MTYLINQTIFQQYEDINVNIKPERLKVFIKKAQELDLKPFLGHSLYYDLLNQYNEDGIIKDDAPQAYKDLVNGSEYLDRYGRIVLYEGISPTLVYFTFSRFIENDAIHYTATGPVIKRHDNGDPLTSPEVVKLVQQQRSIANAYANDIEQFLWDHQESFPLWRYSEKNKSSRQAGPRIRGIDRTDFNYPGSVNNYNLPITDFLN